MHFIVIGGGISGLSASIALQRRGHKVTILEASADFGEKVGAGIQLPPNCTKILKQWGLLEKTRLTSTTPSSIEFRAYDSGEPLSTTELIPGMESRFGAPHLVVHRADLVNVLLSEAKALGVELIPCSLVLAIDFSGASLCTYDGRLFTADAIIGADGERSICRRHLCNNRQDADPTQSLGLLAYRFTIPIEKATRCEVTASLFQENKVTCWLGPNSHVVCYNLTHHGTVNVIAGIPDAGQCGTQTRLDSAPLDEVHAYFATWEPALRELLLAAEDCTAWKLMTYPGLGQLDWVHGDGRFLLIGDAAHAMRPHLAQGAAQAIEDAAALGYLFATVSDPHGVPKTFRQFYETRRERTAQVSERSRQVGRTWSLVDGVQQRERDNQLRTMTPFEGFPNPFSDPALQEWLYGYNPVSLADEIPSGDVVMSDPVTKRMRVGSHESQEDDDYGHVAKKLKARDSILAN